MHSASTGPESQAERIRLLVETINDYAIIILNLDGEVTTWNAGAERIKGYCSGEIIGLPFSLLYGDDGDRCARELAIAASEGKTEDECWIVRKDGSQFWANVVVTRIDDASGKATGFGIVLRDMTERKLHEGELQAKNQALEVAVRELDAFSYSVSHDLRAPLRAIAGFSRILLEENSAIDPQSCHYLHLVRDNAVQMGQLVDDLLAFSRLNRTPLKRQTVRMAALAVQAAREHQLEGRTVDVAVGPLPNVVGDPGLLKLVLGNLIGNAIKFTQKSNNPQIEVGACQTGDEQIIYVRDNGVGFDMRYADKLFGVFQRLHRAEDFEGTGVGLAIVQRIVERHGQRVWAEAKEGKGATFFFTVEVVPP
jgi:PAS domain S-box-containing protein